MDFNTKLQLCIQHIFENLSPEDEEFAISRISQDATDEEKRNQMKYITKQIDDYNQFQTLLKNNKLKQALDSVLKVIKDYGFQIKYEGNKPYMSIEKGEEDNYYLHFNIHGPNTLGDNVFLFDLDLYLNSSRILKIEISSYFVDDGKTWDPTDIIQDENFNQLWKNFEQAGYDLTNFKQYKNENLNKLSLYCTIFPQIQNDQSLNQKTLKTKEEMKHNELLKKEDYGYYKVRTDNQVDGAWIEATSGKDAIENSNGENPILIDYVTPDQARDEWKTGDYSR